MNIIINAATTALGNSLYISFGEADRKISVLLLILEKRIKFFGQVHTVDVP